MRFCFTCGQPIPDDGEICSACATTLGRSCPACSKLVPAFYRFCGYCGLRLPATIAPPVSREDEMLQNLRALMPTALVEKINAASSKIVSERREVTVLFLDVTNFTSAAHTLDSEDVFLWIDESMRVLVDVVYAYEGTIDKFTGDGLMALFGTPVAHENDPERAVRAALDMLAALEPLRERVRSRHGFDFQVRIGVNTGQVIAGTVGNDRHMEYTVIGDTVNLAARLQTAATPGTVLVSSSTYQRTQPLFIYDAVPPLALKGMPHPIPAFRPRGLAARPGSVRGLPGIRSPMIGRADELALLQQAIAAVQAGRIGQVALVSGEAGLGKSRLLAELRAALPSTVANYQGACLAHTRATPLYVVAELLRDMLGFTARDPLDEQRAALQQSLAALDLDSASLAPYLAYALGIGPLDDASAERLRLLDAAMIQRQTHAALRQFMLAQARRLPTLLVFDDLHWVDPASREFLEYLLPTIGEAPLLLALISRDFERATAIQSLLTVARQLPEPLVEIQLRALDAAEAQTLVEQLIPPSTPAAQELTRQVAVRAGGNPFYTEELVRMLIDRGGLIAGASGWEATDRAAAVLQTVPGTLQGLILTRFDSLPDPLRHMLHKAAVLGRSFPLELLAQLEGAGPESLAPTLHELETRQFLAAEPFGAAIGYAFRHVLIQEAVYGTLLKRDRQRLHSAAAATIAAATYWGPEEQAEVLAYHFGESTTPEQAVPYLLAAAEHAAQRYANEIAIGHYRRALSLMEERGARGEAWFRACIGMGQALKVVGQFAEAGQVLNQALQHLEIPLDEAEAWLPIWVGILRELADVRQREGALDEAIAHLEAGLAALGSEGAREHPGLWRLLLDRMAWVRFRQSRLDEAAELAHAATQGLQLDQAEDPITLASLYNTLGGVFWQRGQLTEAIAYVERSRAIYKRLEYAWGMAIAHTNLGILYYVRGLWPRAAEHFERADELRREHGYLAERAVNLNNLGLLRMAMGDHAQARASLEAALAISRRLGDDYGVVRTAAALCQLAIVQSRFDEAAAHLQMAQELLGSANEEEEIDVRRLSALIRAEAGDLESAITLTAQALALARANDLTEAEAECSRTLGTLYTRAGSYAEAEAALRESAELAGQRNDAYRQALALLELGDLYERRDKTPPSRPAHVSQALTAYTQAARIFESLGAAYDLRLAQSALARLQPDRSFALR